MPNRSEFEVKQEAENLTLSSELYARESDELRLEGWELRDPAFERELK